MLASVEVYGFEIELLFKKLFGVQLKFKDESKIDGRPI